MELPKTVKSKYEPYQMRLLERLANQIGNEGTLFHEICAVFKDCNSESDRLKDEVAFYKNIADRNHRANMMPCPNCGYKQTEIRAMVTK